MFKCPNIVPTNFEGTFDEHMENFDWHHMNCPCGIMDLYYFQTVDQDDHVRAYWESEGRLIISWNTAYGRLLRYPKWKEFGNDMFDIGYPY